MALKDWKKDKLGRYFNTKKQLFIFISKQYEMKTFVYEVKIQGTYRTKYDDAKYFIKKKEALKYAKAYMRKH